MNKHNTILTKGLVEAYNSTNFVVHFEPSFVLKVGEFNKKLNSFFQTKSKNCLFYNSI